MYLSIAGIITFINVMRRLISQKNKNRLWNQKSPPVYRGLFCNLFPFYEVVEILFIKYNFFSLSFHMILVLHSHINIPSDFHFWLWNLLQLGHSNSTFFITFSFRKSWAFRQLEFLMQISRSDNLYSLTYRTWVYPKGCYASLLTTGSQDKDVAVLLRRKNITYF